MITSPYLPKPCKKLLHPENMNQGIVLVTGGTKRIGKAIKDNGGWPKGFLLSTKLDRNMDTLVLDKDRARESFEESLKTLNVDAVDVLFLHDPEYAKDITDITKKDGAMDELFKIKNERLKVI